MGEMDYVTTENKQFLHGVLDLLEVAESLIEEGTRTSTVVPTLLYTALDNLSYLGSSETAARQEHGARFKEWCDHYLLEFLGADCTSDDLWGSRSAILHDGTAAARTTPSNKPRELWFTSGADREESQRAFQQELSRKKGDPQRVSLSYERLLHAIASAAIAWADIKQSRFDLDQIEARSSKQLRFVPASGVMTRSDIWERINALQERARLRRHGLREDQHA